MTLSRRWVAAVVAILTLAIAGTQSRRAFERQGDGWEYLLMTEAWRQHASPDIRDGDVRALVQQVEAWHAATGRPVPPAGIAGWVAEETAFRFVSAPDGRQFAVHFWLYPLAAVPARLLLEVCGGDVFNALVLTNVLLVGLALGTVLLAAAGGTGRRVTLGALLTGTPLLW